MTQYCKTATAFTKELAAMQQSEAFWAKLGAKQAAEARAKRAAERAKSRNRARKKKAEAEARAPSRPPSAHGCSRWHGDGW
jgi:hypothetical protein